MCQKCIQTGSCQCSACSQSSTDNIQYRGPFLPCIDVEDRDLLTGILQKIDAILCSMSTTTTSSSTTSSTTTIVVLSHQYDAVAQDCGVCGASTSITLRNDSTLFSGYYYDATSGKTVFILTGSHSGSGLPPTSFIPASPLQSTCAEVICPSTTTTTTSSSTTSTTSSSTTSSTTTSTTTLISEDWFNEITLT